MINKILNKILLPKYENEINIITSDLSNYWGRSHDFSHACLSYFLDLNIKYELGFDPIEITEIVTTLIMKCIVFLELNNTNTARLYGEFIYYVVFGGKLPCYIRNKKETIMRHLDNFESYVIDNPKPWNDMITKVLDRNKILL